MFSDPQFWVAIAFIAFVVAVFSPVRKILNNNLDQKIKYIKDSIDEAENLKNEAKVTLIEIKKRQNEVQKKIELIKKDSENKGKTRIYQPDEEILVKTPSAGIFLKEVKVGSYLKQGQKIGEVRDIYSGKKLEELISSEDGLLITLRQYPIVYEKEPVAIILKAKNSWREYFPWNR